MKNCEEYDEGWQGWDDQDEHAKGPLQWKTPWCSDGGCGGVDRVEIVGAVTSVEHHPGTGILNRKAKHVKFNGDRIFTCKRMNRNKIFNDVR